MIAKAFTPKTFSNSSPRKEKNDGKAPGFSSTEEVTNPKEADLSNDLIAGNHGKPIDGPKWFEAKAF